MRRDATGAGHALIALGSHGALGVSPFGVDSGDDEVLTEFADLYALLTPLRSMISATRLEDMHGFLLADIRPEESFTIGGQRFVAERRRSWGGRRTTGVAYGLVLATGPEEFVAVGRGFQLTPVAESDGRVGIAAVDELKWDGMRLDPGRRLNGDETDGGTAWIHPALGHAPVTEFPIPAVGQGSGISTCIVYSY